MEKFNLSSKNAQNKCIGAYELYNALSAEKYTQYPYEKEELGEEMYVVNLMDEDGYGMTDDEEITIYGFIDRTGRPLVKFRHIDDYNELNEMEQEARKSLLARK